MDGFILYAFSMPLFSIKINGRARSKKNSKTIARTPAGRPFITSSRIYKAWQVYATMTICRKKFDTINHPCNLSVKCYYKDHQHEQDLENIISSVADVLQESGVIKNDKLFYSYDGSRKIFGSDTEFVEIEITDFKP
jgi:Holliday junction resolvase RusA-like endonuclease